MIRSERAAKSGQAKICSLRLWEDADEKVKAIPILLIVVGHAALA